MEIITLEKEKIQTISVILGMQNCTLRLYQMPSMMYIDVIKDGQVVVLGVPCLSFTKIIRYSYLNFAGDLFFVDYNSTGGIDGIETNLPNYTDLGTRYDLYYLSQED